MPKKRVNKDLSEEFISIFNEVDAYLRKISGLDATVSHMFVVDRLGETNKFVHNHKEDLKLYARLRNAIVHNPFGSQVEVIAEPHPAVVDKYRSLKESLMNPPPALSVAVKPQKIYSTTMAAIARDTMRVMADRGFTYVPVLDDARRITGIFSENTVFLYLARNETCSVDRRTLIAEFVEYLPFNQHVSEYFEFVSRDATLDNVRDLFERGLADRKRLAAVFITEDGRKDDELLGMITAWDVAGNNK